MIRYGVTAAEIEAAVDAIDARWRANASTRAERIRRAGSYDEPSSTWSAVKPVFIDIQRNKCAFCERQLESVEYGRIEYDLEHFRPKSAVFVWPDPKRHPELAYAFPTGAAGSGYHWLAYELSNYAAACKICNSIFKHDFFPVEGDRARAHQTAAELAPELALLCHPIGDADDDPEDLLSFVATTARPRSTEGRRGRRGRVIIDLFGLNVREDLHRERARMIALIGPALLNVANGTGDATDEAVLKLAENARVPHANCVRSFCRLWDEDRPTALRAYRLCRVYGLQEPGAPPPQL